MNLERLILGKKYVNQDSRIMVKGLRNQCEEAPVVKTGSYEQQQNNCNGLKHNYIQSYDFKRKPLRQPFKDAREATIFKAGK